MSRLTTDPTDSRLNANEQGKQNDVYLILSDEERAKGFVRPVRKSYIHTKCGTVTSMGQELSETYAREPTFYGSTYCYHCGTHLPVGEFKWTDDRQVVGS